MSKEFSQDITEPTVIPFAIESFGLYALKIVARCQSGGLLGFRGGQDLRIEIDGIKFREIPPQDKPQYYNIPSAWNGTELKGLAKTIFFILPLNKGTHTLTCIPNKGARLESLEVTPINNLREVDFELDERAEDGDKRPWCTFALINLPLKSMSADVSVSWHFLDGDDVKLIIDNKVEENAKSKLWKRWVWSARPWYIFSGEKRESKEFSKNLLSGTHYVEFWADKSPTLHQVILDLGDFQLKRIPTRADPEWTGDFEDDTEEMLLARLIFGESENQSKEAKVWIGGSVLNRVKSSAWPNKIHEVILQAGQFDPIKPSDSNFKKIIDPLNTTNELRITAWNESFEIAHQLVAGEITNPTTATHFHGVGVTPEWFIENVVPQGKFLRKINDTYFYWSPN